MGAFYETIPESIIPWILAQKMFCVATAPLSGRGHVNISPKGGAYFGVLDPRTFWYMDLTGSGSETIAHLYEPGNGRITIMLNAFEGPPRILRLWGTGRVLENDGTPGSAFGGFVKKHDVKLLPGARAVVLVDIHQVGTSCGFSVPRYEFREYRTTLNEFFEKKDGKYKEGNEKESMPRYWALKNSWSMDGLPALHVAQRTRVQEAIEPLRKMVGPLAPATQGGYYYQDGRRFGLGYLLLVALVTAVATALSLTYGRDALAVVVNSRLLPGPAGGSGRFVHAPSD